MHGPFWFVPFGRKDSLTSHFEDAAQVPHQESDANTLLKQFTAFGLSFSDLATLTDIDPCQEPTRLGSHIASHSQGEEQRGKSQDECDICTHVARDVQEGPWEAVFNDETTPFLLDLEFYKNLKKGNVLLKSDNSIYTDNNMTSSLVDAFLTHQACGMHNLQCRW
ncbi:hypothetical protein L7F22_049186 [Adiantum nelumboides]|nr:hypothetical protein [Adiantum nelumboides]